MRATDARDKHCSVAPVCVLGSWTACAIIDLDLDSPDRARSTSTSSVATRDRAHTETRARWQISAAIEKEPSGSHRLREAHVHCRLMGDLRSREAPFHRSRARCPLARALRRCVLNLPPSTGRQSARERRLHAGAAQDQRHGVHDARVGGSAISVRSRLEHGSA